MTQLLNELRDALEQAMAEGVDANFLIQGITDSLSEESETQTAPKPEQVEMMTDSKYKKIEAELAEANMKIQDLKKENNSLVLIIKKLEAERK